MKSLFPRALSRQFTLIGTLGLALSLSATAAEVAALNGDFEQGLAGWSGEGFTRESEDANHFLRMTADPSRATVSASAKIELPEVPALEFTWRQRISGLRRGAQPWYDARLVLDFLDKSDRPLEKARIMDYRQKKTDGWVEKSRRFLVPEGASRVLITTTVFQSPSGTFDVDDLKFTPMDTAPLLADAAQKELEAQKRYVAPEEPMKEKWPPQLRVQGNRIVNPAGEEVWLQGLNAGGLESSPDDRQMIKSAVVGVDEWKANVVRLPVKEIYWFGQYARQTDGGEDYRAIIDQIITLVANRGAYVVLDLHRFRAPRQEHADFWASAAARYANHPAVLFDLLNEPHGISWEVWRDGGFVSEAKGTDESAFLSEAEKAANKGFQSVGMQALLDTVREMGAKNVVVVGGLEWASDLRGITEGFALDDRGGNGIVYSWHIYNWHTGWEAKVLPAAAQHPILVGEFGADPNKMNFIPHEIQEDPYTWVPDILGFIQMHRLNWTGWCFHPRWTPVMISDWDYTPTPFWGAFAKDALAGKQFEMKKAR